MKLQHLPALRRHFGTGWLVRRALYSLQLRSGALRRRTPIHDWDEGSVLFLPRETTPARAEEFFEYRRAHPLPFFFSAADRPAYRPLLGQWDDKDLNPMREADGLVRGSFRFFEHHELECGLPPDWHSNAFTKRASPATDHWSRIGDFGYGDIKAIWEPSRFGYAYALVRAYWRTGDEVYPETFWRLLESWRENNPPQRGANWKCGQEATFRAMAWCFALHGFWDSPATTSPRTFHLAQMLGATAERIAANINYAIAQANNHGISEGVGLWTIGLLFPEFRQAEAWCERGRAVLEAEGRKLIYDDGAFSQHSVNYHRLMLHDFIWALRLGELHDRPFTEELRQRVARAGEFLFQLQDETTGETPYYGQNDGALILPLNNCGYRDFRPVVNATHYLAHRTRQFADGPWSEDLLWLFGRESLGAGIESRCRSDFQADFGGYYTLRSPGSFTFMRCASFHHRPGQADMLHVDLWWRGQNIACDAGTYSYNSAEPWANDFAGTAVHNTVTVDGRNQMEQAGKFLWIPWLRSNLRAFRRSGALAYMEGEHDGYTVLRRAVRHRRAVVQLDAERWLILDDLRNSGGHNYRLHWLLPDLPYQYEERRHRLSLGTPAGAYHLQAGTITGATASSLARAAPESARGWRAPFYNYRAAALSFALEQNAISVLFWTLFSPTSCSVEAGTSTIRIQSPSGLCEISLANDEDPACLVTRIISSDAQLELNP